MSVPLKKPFKQLYIKLVWKDGFGEGGNEFETLQKFADFLNENPEIKKALKEGVGTPLSDANS